MNTSETRDVAISVCVPTYNYRRYLPETLDSILAQNFTDFELLVIDDHSSDDTERLLAEYAKKDKRIRFIVNPRRLGMVPNWNRCLSEAKGRYIKFVLADDMLPAPDALKVCFSLLESNRAISLVSSSRKIIDSESRILKTVSLFTRDKIIPGSHIISLCLARQANLIGEPSAVMFRKIDALRSFDTRYSQIADMEMWFYLLEKGSFAFIHRPLAAFRVHSSQQTAINSGDPLAIPNEKFRLNNAYLGKSWVTLHRTTKSFVRYDNAYEVWKLHRLHRIQKERAIREIDSRLGYWKFLLLYGPYKLYKPILKLARHYRPLQSYALAPMPGQDLD